MLQYLLPRDPLAFTRYFYKCKEGRSYIVNEHHRLMADVKKDVFEGNIKRLIVNIPPGYSKTEEWVVNFIAQGLAINPQALFMHLSYAENLALWNSTQAKDIVESGEFQELFPMKIRNDVSSKKKWYTEQGGGVYATSAGGQVTGFRAGRIIDKVKKNDLVIQLEKTLLRLHKKLDALEDKGEGQEYVARKLRRRVSRVDRKLSRHLDKALKDDFEFARSEVKNYLTQVDKLRTHGMPEFWGALIIDDPIKPDEGLSETLRAKINNRFMNTFKSRLAVESETPMVLVMQRIHEEDPSGFLLKGGTGEKWHHLLLPVEVEKDFTYPKDYTHGILIPHNLPEGPLWAAKHSAKEIEDMRKADPYTSSSQYFQAPTQSKSLIFKPEYWRYYTAIPENIAFKRIYCDTAQKTEDHHDYTVFQCWGYVPGMGLVLIDLYRDRLESPQLKQALTDFWNKHKYKKWVNPVGAQIVKVEDKSSGSGLIQTIQQETTIPIEGIPRHRDKVMRALDCVPHISTGNVWLPAGASWLHDFKEECRLFTPLMTHKHDDQIDPMLDAIQDILIDQVNMYGAI